MALHYRYCYYYWMSWILPCPSCAAGRCHSAVTACSFSLAWEPASPLARFPSAAAHVDLAFSAVSAVVPISAADAAVPASAVVVAAAFVVVLVAYFVLVAAIAAADAVVAAAGVGTVDCRWKKWKRLLLPWDWSAPWEGRQVPDLGWHYGGQCLERQQGAWDSCWW